MFSDKTTKWRDLLGNADTLKSLLVSAVVILFFVSVILAYYSMLYDERRNTIIKNGQMSARSTADQVNDYLDVSFNAVKMTAYTLDEMQNQGQTTEEFQGYISRQTIAVRSTVFENTDGIYAYFPDRSYFHAAGWIPGEDYDPESRPWYKKALEKKGEVVLVSPYRSLSMGQDIVISIAKTLSDEKSVVSMDVKLDKIHEIVENTVAEGHSDYAVILDSKNLVVAHSDQGEVGKIYDGRDADSLWTEIMKKKEIGDKDYFEISHNDIHYIVYTAPVKGEWICLSVKDMGSTFRPLKRLLAVTLAVIFLVVLVLGCIMVKFNRRRQATLEALAANEAKSSFLSNMSHEIRTPINAILGMNEMILRESEDEAVLSYAGNIRTAGTTLLGLVNDILDFSKIEAGRMEIIPVEYGLSSLLNDLVNMIKGKAEAKSLELVPDFDPRLPSGLFGDEIRLKQIITNLLTNAIKYTNQGKVTFRVGFLPGKIPGEEIFLQVAVEDTGIGIKEEDIPKLFAKFQRIEEKRNRKVEGTGLGMSITSKLLGMMGSKLEVKSVYGEGSVFHFSVKQKVLRWAPLGDSILAGTGLPGTGKRYRETFIAPEAEILVVDDTPMNITVFQSLLKRTRVKIDTAKDGEEGVRAAGEKKYDIIFLDHMMPNKDGIEALLEIRSEPACPNRETAAVCLTANAISGAREKYLAAGFDDYLTKPVDPMKLEELLLRFLPPEKTQILEPGEEEKEESVKLPPFLEELEEIDLSAGLASCGSKETYLFTLQTYGEKVEDYIREIEDFYQAGDLSNTTIKIHALKSTSRIIGAKGIGELAQALEDAGKAGDRETLGAEIGEFLERCRELGQKLAPLCLREKDVEEDAPLITAEELKEAYGMIRESLEEGQLQSIDDIAEMLKGYRIPEGEAERVKDVLRAVRELDYESLPGILEKGRESQ